VPATSETWWLWLRREWVAATHEVTSARTARTTISAVLAHPGHEQSSLPSHADPCATLVPPPTLSCSFVTVALGATPNEPIAGLSPSTRSRPSLCRRLVIGAMCCTHASLWLVVGIRLLHRIGLWHHLWSSRPAAWYLTWKGASVFLWVIRLL